MAGVKGRVALVTGAGSVGGIGFAIARALVNGGARVCITSTSSRIHDRAAELDAEAHVADLTVPEAVADLVSIITAKLGPIGILVNDVGMVQPSSDDVTVLLSGSWQTHLDTSMPLGGRSHHQSP